jgi:mxaD protein
MIRTRLPGYPFATSAALGLTATLFCAPALARETLAVTEQIELSAPPATTWQLIGRFDGLHQWHPAFRSDEIVRGENNVTGAVRLLTLQDGGRITEELLAYSGEAMRMRYRITNSPLPLTAYVATLEVSPGKDGGSRLTWSSTFQGRDGEPGAGGDDASLKKLVTGLYTAGFAHLTTLLAARSDLPPSP